MTSPATAKPLRADARRNYEALLAAGKAVFARSGTDANLEDVAKEAGVGQGTLYRHFPSREHLFVAIMKEQVDQLEAKAVELVDVPDPWEALTTWLRLYDRSASRYRGMSARVGNGLAEDASPMAAACAPMKTAFVQLFARTQAEGVVRGDVTAIEVLTLVAALPEHASDGDHSGNYLDIVLRGIRK
ncbi:TetR/AcrR family transcriptional regulator [Streptomyces sp. NPDC005917]|uniref:TetR/AcrR family transcriptional regulator n=1 Tax=unclassified Streptomyces TaxID=2593676 RepID=UPI0033D07B69